MVNCSSYKCTSRSEKKELNVTFHRFPSDPVLKEIWVEALKLKNWYPTSNDRLCSKHFEDNCFFKTALKTNLCDGAIPTIFPQFPKYMQTKKVKENTMSSTRRSAIWNVFTETHKSDFLATCNICNQELSYRSTTTNLMKHIKRKHPDISLADKCGGEKQKEIEIVVQRQLENECEIESFKVEVKAASEGESNFIVLGSGKGISPLWDFFSKVPDSNNIVTCNYCKEKVSCNTISNLKKHLLGKHSRNIKVSSILSVIKEENDEQTDVQFQSPKDIDNIENNPNLTVNNLDIKDDDAFWNVDDNDDCDIDFRPSPGIQDDFECKLSKRRSQIWNVFTEKPNSDFMALCNICNQEFCYRSTTNNLKKHFQRKHPNISMDNKIEPVKLNLEPPDPKFCVKIRKEDTDDEDEEKDEEGKKSKRKTSLIWNYFTKKKSADYIATCNICRKELGYRSTTSNLKKHLDRRHSEVTFVKTEDSNKPATPEVPVKTCLICLQKEDVDNNDFIQVNNCDTDSKSYINKIQEVVHQPVVIDESHVLCQSCIAELDRVNQFKDKIMKAFEFWSKTEQEPETEMDSIDMNADEEYGSDYSDLENGESLAKFTCSKCNKVFPSPSVMLKHNCNQPKVIKNDVKTLGNENFFCEHCGKGFSIKWKLMKHLKRCPNIVCKQFTCNLCNREFKKAYHLREHMASHTGERNYSCNICGKTFQRSSSKHKHMRSHNAKPGEKSKKTPFLCTICGKSFPYSNGASRHMRVHLGERRHECHICLKRFSQTTHLKVHLRTHSGERPYSCMICSRTFSLNASLRKHMRLHVGSGEFAKLVNNLENNMDDNMDNNLDTNLMEQTESEENQSINLATTLVTNLGVIETNLDGSLENNIETHLENNISHTEVVTEDGIHVLTHQDIHLEGSQ